MGAVWRGSSAGMCESLAARISAFTSPTVCVDTVPPVPRSRVWVLVDDGVAGARERGGFSVNEDVGDVERVQEDRLEHRSRRRKAACRSDGLCESARRTKGVGVECSQVLHAQILSPKMP